MKKICHMISGHSNTDVRVFYKQCISLYRTGYDVYLLAHGESYELNGIKIKGIPKINGFKLKRIIQRIKQYTKMALEIDADIYQIHEIMLLPCALKLHKKGKKIIFDSHENYFLQIPHYLFQKRNNYVFMLFKKIIAEIYRMYETNICRKIEAVIFPCTMNNGINIFENRAKQTVFINNVPILDEFYYNYDANYIKKDRTICYVGGLTHIRGITNIIKATYKANARLILAGEFNSQFYREEVNTLKEYQCVEYTGYAERNQVIEIYKYSNIGISILLNTGQYHKADNLPTKVYEYMSMGLPVIISNYEYAQQVNDKYNCFSLVNPENIDEIANAINYLLDNPEIAKKMGENGRRAILEEFNWTIEEKKLVELYNNITIGIENEKKYI